MPRVDTGKPNGRPTKKNAQAIARILKVARTGLPLKFAAQAGNIDAETLAQWRVKDPEFDRALSQARLAAVEEKWKQIQKAAQDRLDADGNLIKAGDWKCLAWSLERAYPAEFARPEVALNLAMQNNVTQNFLSISISGTEAKAIEAEAAPIRESVAQMFSKYRPAVLGNGNGAGGDEAVASSVQQPAKPAMITHKVGDEKSQAFWRLLVGSDPEKSIVAKATATFVCRMILAEVLGYRAAGVKVEFKDDPVRLCDVLGAIDKSCDGPSGWQLMQKKAGYCDDVV
jgi:hypothetical protein